MQLSNKKKRLLLKHENHLAGNGLELNIVRTTLLNEHYKKTHHTSVVSFDRLKAFLSGVKVSLLIGNDIFNLKSFQKVQQCG